uniref:Uncharacterized protein n=1 Tax=Sinocyclocheilus anshuiensis TaxID=1608454 RepID=A0A671S101_9TELE
AESAFDMGSAFLPDERLLRNLDKALYISPMEARRNVKMVLFERRDPNLKDNIEYIDICGCLRLTEAVINIFYAILDPYPGPQSLTERDTRTKALEGHLHAARAEVKTVTQQFCNIKEELDMVQKELKQSYRLYKEGMTLKDLNRMARNILAFTPELVGDNDVHAYLQDIGFHLQSWTSVNHQDRLYLLWITPSPEVRRFLAQQPGHIQSDYQKLRQAIIKEFSDPESEHGLIAALATEKGRHETPHAYYHRLQRTYFGAHNEPGMEEDTSFKSFFLRNLHAIVSHHLDILACPYSMPIQQLRDLTQKAFNKHKASTKGVCKTLLILHCTTQNPKRAPEGTQHCQNAKPFYQKLLGSRRQSHHHGNRPRLQTNYWEKPWKRPFSSCEQHGMSNSNPPQHPPLHPSHRCQTEATQGQLDTPIFELQELLTLINKQSQTPHPTPDSVPICL